MPSATSRLRVHAKVTVCVVLVDGFNGGGETCVYINTRCGVRGVLMSIASHRVQ